RSLAARTDQGHRAGPARGDRGPDGSRGMGHFRPEGEDRQLSTTESAIEIKRALVSVYDKTGLDELARALHEAGVEIVSTGSTAAVIAGTGVPVTRVEELTGFPECLDGRVKTLHPKVHAGLLADLTRPEPQNQLGELGMEPFQLLVSNLYPFESTVASGAPPEQCVEEIDIGGPAMVRAAAKNHANVAVVTSPLQYAEVLGAPGRGRVPPHRPLRQRGGVLVRQQLRTGRAGPGERLAGLPRRRLVPLRHP